MYLLAYDLSFKDLCCSSKPLTSHSKTSLSPSASTSQLQKQQHRNPSNDGPHTGPANTKPLDTCSATVPLHRLGGLTTNQIALQFIFCLSEESHGYISLFLRVKYHVEVIFSSKMFSLFPRVSLPCKHQNSSLASCVLNSRIVIPVQCMHLVTKLHLCKK